MLEKGRLLFQGQLVVPDQNDLYARLLDKIHQQPSTVYPGRKKTLDLVKT
jgi:hypothetical protein